MSEPQFKIEYHPTNIPVENAYTFEVDLDITEEMLNWIHTAIIIKSDANIPLFGFGYFEIPYWRDYWRVYGDNVLLYQSYLRGIKYKTLNSIDYFHLTLDNTNLWRGLYFNNNYVLWTNISIPQWKYIDFTVTNGIESSREIICPEQTNIKTGTGNPPPAPTPPTYPTPPYNQIKITRNIPDLEYFPDIFGLQSSQYASSHRKNILKIGENKYKLFVIGDLFSFPPSKLIEEIELPVFTKIYTSELWEELIYNSPTQWTWERGYKYNLSSSTVSTTTKKFYAAEPLQIDVKLLVSIVNPTTMKEVKQYSLTNITGVRG